MEEKIRFFALENAVKFKGKASLKAVLGKLFSSYPDLRKDKEIMKKIIKTIEEVNHLTPEMQKKELLKINPDHFGQLKKKKHKNREQRLNLPPLKNAEKGKVVTRMPPEPSKYNHIGHAISFLINYLYADMYDGKCILRFDDTNPEKETKEYADAVEEDVLEYLDIKPSKVLYASDNMNKYYEFAEKLIREGKAYTCFDSQEEISKQRRDMADSKDRDKPVDIVLDEWKKMLSGKYKEGECVLRLKIDMKHKNAVMRDPVIFRLCYTRHYRQKDKYRVWPLYDFESAVEEGLNKITHVMRSNEFATRIELQNHVFELLGFPKPEFKQYGRFNILGAVTQGREIRELIESGKYLGWDDPRLVTLRALKRRGIVRQTFYELARQIGMSKSQTNIDFSVISSINRRILDESAKRFFFIRDPVKIRISGAPERKLVLDMHPFLDLGKREFTTDENYIVEKSDFEKIKEEKLARLMDNLNFVKKNDGLFFDSEDYEKYKKNGSLIIHFLPDNPDYLIDVEIMMPDTKIVKGLAEKNIAKIKQGDVIQFQRFGFCRLDRIEKGRFFFWFTHE